MPSPVLGTESTGTVQSQEAAGDTQTKSQTDAGVACEGMGEAGQQAFLRRPGGHGAELEEE